MRKTLKASFILGPTVTGSHQEESTRKNSMRKEQSIQAGNGKPTHMTSTPIKNFTTT